MTSVTHVVEAADGTFRIGPLIAGIWEFSVTTARHPRVERNGVELASGEVTDLGEIRLQASVPVEAVVRYPPSVGRVRAYLFGPGAGRYYPIESGRVALPPLGAGEYELQVWSANAPREVREFELLDGQDLRLEVDLQPEGVPRVLGVLLPDGVESDVLRITTFDAAGRALVSWRDLWFSGSRDRMAFRPEAVSVVVAMADGRCAEARLDRAEVWLDLR